MRGWRSTAPGVFAEQGGGKGAEEIHHHPCTITPPPPSRIKCIDLFLVYFMLVCMSVYVYNFSTCVVLFSTNLYLLEKKSALFFVFFFYPSWDKM